MNFLRLVLAALISSVAAAYVFLVVDYVRVIPTADPEVLQQSASSMPWTGLIYGAIIFIYVMLIVAPMCWLLSRSGRTGFIVQAGATTLVTAGILSLVFRNAYSWGMDIGLWSTAQNVSASLVLGVLYWIVRRPDLRAAPKPAK